MNATKRSVVRAGLVLGSVLTVALTGCRTHVVHSHTRPVYVRPPPVVHVTPAPAPPPVVHVTPPSPPPVVVTPPVPAPVVVIQSVDDFYAPLAAHGRWVVAGSYGRVWVPVRVDVGWRPYANGYWQRTDAGWYWMSDEPWGWATYHYGRWDWHGQFGWIWVPQTQWAPAWVCWREGGSYIGWAALRPSVSVGVNTHVVDYEPAFAARAFVFVEQRRMLEPVRPKTVVVNNTTVINKTVDITNVKVVNKTVINEGPRPEAIERASGRRVQAIPVHEFRRREETTVAARQRDLANVERKVQPRSTEIHVAPKAPSGPRGNPVVETPVANPKPSAVAAPVLPSAPARPTYPATVARAPARSGNKPGPETSVNAVPTLATVTPKAKPEVRPAPTVATWGTLRRGEDPVNLPPIKMWETANPSVVERQPDREIRSDARPPVKVEPVRPTPTKIEAPQPPQKPANKRLMSPKEKSQLNEQTRANRKHAKRQDAQSGNDDQPMRTPGVLTRPGR